MRGFFPRRAWWSCWWNRPAPGVRLEVGPVAEGREVSLYCQSARQAYRVGCRSRDVGARRRLSEYEVYGIKTTIPGLPSTGHDQAAGFIAGEFDTGYIDGRRLDEVPKRPGARRRWLLWRRPCWRNTVAGQCWGGRSWGCSRIGSILASGTTDRSLPGGHTDGGGLDPWLSRVYVDMRRSGHGW